MINFRVIPKLEVKDFNLVKGIKLEGLRALGDPLEDKRSDASFS